MMIPVIRQSEKEVVGLTCLGETIRVAARDDKYPIYHSDIGPDPCSLAGYLGVFMILDHRCKPLVMGQDEMLFILWAIDQLGGGPMQLRRTE